MTGKWLWVMLTSAATSAWLIYDMATATQAPRQTVALLNVVCSPASRSR